MVMVAVCPQWREAGVGERELGRSLLQGMGQKGSSKLTWRGGCELGGGALGAGLLPQEHTPACQAPTCLTSLPGIHVLTSFPDSPRRWVTHCAWGVSGAGAVHRSLSLGLGCLVGSKGEGVVSSIWRRQA